MHCRQLIEAAALTAAHGPVFIRATNHISLSGMECYWSASKCRMDRWLRTLKALGDELQSAPQMDRPLIWEELRPTLEEILTSEILTRVWTAVTTQYDRLRGANDVEPMTRSVFVGHLEARNRAMGLLIGGPGVAVEEAVGMNRLRRQCERWNDLLLGHLLTDYDVREFAFDERRAKDFSLDLEQDERIAHEPMIWSLVMSSVRVAFQQGLAEQSANADLNERITSSILSCFQAELFDSTGLIKSKWMERMGHAAADTQGLVDLLLSEDEGAPPDTLDSRQGTPDAGPFRRF